MLPKVCLPNGLQQAFATFFGYSSFLRAVPSKKAMRDINAEIKSLTCRKNLVLPEKVVVNNLNEIVRGWVNYFYYGQCSNDLLRLKRFLDERVRTYLRRKHRMKRRGYKAFPYRYLHEDIGLYKIPSTVPLDLDGESLWKKIVRKPYSGKLNVLFDEGKLEVEP